ncbi:hypothetical protein CBS101457_004825 [Exobasidium rhododendri]|nr:hypothetical protein CBS101457_004825 [Exobasidium rhododendri]
MQTTQWSRLTSMLLLSMGIALFLSYTSANASTVLTHQVHERRQVSPHGWSQGDRMDKRAILPIRIALKQSNMENLDQFLMEVSEPDSANYGKHWSPDQILSTFAPSQETRDTVTAWLIASGIVSQRLSHNTGSGGWISFEATVAEAETLFQTQYHSWTNPFANDGLPHAAVSGAYSLPAHVQPHVDFVTPTLHFDTKLSQKKQKRDITGARSIDGSNTLEKRVKNMKKIKLGSPHSPTLPKHVPLRNDKKLFGDLQQCNMVITPACLRALYGIPTLSKNTVTNSKNSFGIVEYSPQQYVPSDLLMFFSNYSTSQKQLAPKLISIDGGNITAPVSGFSYNGESNLDLEYSMTLVNPLKVTLYQTGDPIESASFNDFLDAFDASYCKGDDPTQDSMYPDPSPGGYDGPKTCGGVTPAKVISTSYSYNEADLTYAYEKRQCNEYAKFGLLGTTFTYSSGDYGVAGNSGQCIDPTTGVYNDGTDGKFNPSFPGTCPYILSIGATQIDPGASVSKPESACQQVIYSGGGFSNNFPLPAYQRTAVKNYFKYHKPSYGADRYNNSQNTRGFPDVSANGANYVVSVDGSFELVYGTSASSPTFASVLTLINEQRLNIGKSSLGFVNPVLYANPSLLNDITNGTNQGCGTLGFSAVPAWDPVTGLGTPNYPKMLAYFLTH